MHSDATLGTSDRLVHPETSKGSHRKDQVGEDVWIRLWDEPASVKAEAMEDTFDGKLIDREMQLATNLRMFFLVLFTLITPYFFLELPQATSRSSPSIIILCIVLSSFFLALLGRAVAEALCLRLACVCSYGIRSWKKSVSDKELRELLRESSEGASNKLTTMFLSSWKGWVLFSPFYYRFVWWWTLLFGLCSVQVEHALYMTKEKQLSEDIESKIMAELAISVLKVLIVSVIAFIATNILREVLTLRERYSANLTQAERLSKELNLLGTSIERVRPMSSQMYDVLANCLRTLDLSTKLVQFNQQIMTRSPQEQSESHRFLRTIEDQIDNFLYQITKADEGYSKLLILGVLNRLLELQREFLNTRQCRVMARFSDLAALGTELVNVGPLQGISVPLKFYGLMALPPKRFLNNRTKLYPDGKVQEVIGDAKWEAYLKGNREAALRGIDQTRFFLSVKGLSDISEVSDLERRFVRDALSSWVEMNDDGTPRRRPNDFGDMHYVIEDEVPSSSERKWMRLADVIASVYHAPDSCYIREFDLSEYETQLQDLEKHKPLDYFAVRYGEEWIFCLQTLYDKDLDAADIEIFFPGPHESGVQAQWEILRDKLDMIFLNTGYRGAVFRMEEY